MKNKIKINFLFFRDYQVLSEDETGELSTISVDVPNVPTLRYIRNVAKTQLDLVVSIGGVAGLFFGASILSLVEFFYIWFYRKF